MDRYKAYTSKPSLYWNRSLRNNKKTKPIEDNSPYRQISSTKPLHKRIIPLGYKALIKNKEYICRGCFRSWSPHHHFYEPQRVGGGYSILVKKEYREGHFYRNDNVSDYEELNINATENNKIDLQGGFNGDFLGSRTDGSGVASIISNSSCKSCKARVEDNLGNRMNSKEKVSRLYDIDRIVNSINSAPILDDFIKNGRDKSVDDLRIQILSGDEMMLTDIEENVQPECLKSFETNNNTDKINYRITEDSIPVPRITINSRDSHRLETAGSSELPKSANSTRRGQSAPTTKRQDDKKMSNVLSTQSYNPESDLNNVPQEEFQARDSKGQPIIISRAASKTSLANSKPSTAMTSKRNSLTVQQQPILGTDTGQNDRMSEASIVGEKYKNLLRDKVEDVVNYTSSEVALLKDELECYKYFAQKELYEGYNWREPRSSKEKITGEEAIKLSRDANVDEVEDLDKSSEIDFDEASRRTSQVSLTWSNMGERRQFISKTLDKYLTMSAKHENGYKMHNTVQYLTNGNAGKPVKSLPTDKIYKAYNMNDKKVKTKFKSKKDLEEAMKDFVEFNVVDQSDVNLKKLYDEAQDIYFEHNEFSDNMNSPGNSRGAEKARQSSLDSIIDDIPNEHELNALTRVAKSNLDILNTVFKTATEDNNTKILNSRDFQNIRDLAGNNLHFKNTILAKATQVYLMEKKLANVSESKEAIERNMSPIVDFMVQRDNEILSQNRGRGNSRNLGDFDGLGRGREKNTGKSGSESSRSRSRSRNRLGIDEIARRSRSPSPLPSPRPTIPKSPFSRDTGEGPTKDPIKSLSLDGVAETELDRRNKLKEELDKLKDDGVTIDIDLHTLLSEDGDKKKRKLKRDDGEISEESDSDDEGRSRRRNRSRNKLKGMASSDSDQDSSEYDEFGKLKDPRKSLRGLKRFTPQMSLIGELDENGSKTKFTVGEDKSISEEQSGDWEEPHREKIQSVLKMDETKSMRGSLSDRTTEDGGSNRNSRDNGSAIGRKGKHPYDKIGKRIVSLDESKEDEIKYRDNDLNKNNSDGDSGMGLDKDHSDFRPFQAGQIQDKFDPNKIKGENPEFRRRMSSMVLTMQLASDIGKYIDSELMRESSWDDETLRQSISKFCIIKPERVRAYWGAFEMYAAQHDIRQFKGFIFIIRVSTSSLTQKF